MTNQTKLKKITKYISNTKLSEYLGVSDRYIRYIKEGKKPALNLTSRIDALYKNARTERKIIPKRRQNVEYIGYIETKNALKPFTEERINTILDKNTLVIRENNLYFKNFYKFLTHLSHIINVHKKQGNYNYVHFKFNMKFTTINNLKVKDVIELDFNTASVNLRFNKRKFEYIEISKLDRFKRAFLNYLKNEMFSSKTKKKNKKEYTFKLLLKEGVLLERIDLYFIKYNEAKARIKKLKELEKREQKLQKELAQLNREKRNLME